MKLSELLARSGIFCRVAGNADPEITSIHTDSRRVCRNSLFVCIRGLKQDSHLRTAEAASRGAAAVIEEEGSPPAPTGVLTVYTPDTRIAAARLYNGWYGDPARDMKLIAVTGTNGKTTVTYMLDSVFSAAMHKCGVIGTVRTFSPLGQIDVSGGDENANLTTPDPEQLYAALRKMKDDGAEYVFMEVSSHALALHKTDPLTFEAAIFTNLTPEHLDFHGNMENYFLAKAGLLRQTRLAILNADDEWTPRYLSYALACGCGCDIVTASTHRRDADYFADGIKTDGGISYTLVTRSALRRLRSSIPGEFNVMNSLQCAACATELGIGGKYVCDGLSVFTGAPGRLEKVRMPAGYGATVYIDYAHTPDALENLLITARNFMPAGKKLWLVTGCGGDRDKTKRSVMGGIASRMADYVILTADNSRGEKLSDIIGEIVKGLDPGTPHAVITDRKDAIRYAVENAEDGDVILLAGKGHERYEIDRNGKRYFNEAQIAVEAASDVQKRK